MLVTGQIACLAAALLWAVALTFFRGPIREHGARSVNLVKCGLGALLQGLTVLLLGQLGVPWSAPWRSLLFVVASGLVGLVLGDTALFAAVARLGVHRALLLQTLSPVFAAVIALAWQGEVPTAGQLAGSVVVLCGVALVVAPGRWKGRAGPSWATTGIVVGVVAAFGQAGGLVLAKVGMADVPVLAASFLRLAAAAVGLSALALLRGRLAPVAAVCRPGVGSARVVTGTLLGTYLALFLMMAGLALAPTGVAAVLLATSPVFSLILEAVIDRQRVTLRGALGTLLAVAGVAVLTMAGGG